MRIRVSAKSRAALQAFIAAFNANPERAGDVSEGYLEFSGDFAEDVANFMNGASGSWVASVKYTELP